MIKIIVATETLTEREAGGLCSLLLTLYPDAMTTAIDALTDNGQLRLDLPTTNVVVHRQELVKQQPAPPPAGTMDDPHTINNPPPPPAAPPADMPSAAEAFAPQGAAAPEAGVPFEPASSATAPAPAPAPTAPAEPATAPAGVELDSEGLPWDKRIHSDPPSLTKKGPWRAKRNLNQLVEHQVKAELRAALAAPAAPLAAAPPPPPAPAETPAERTAREAVEQGLIAAPAMAAPAPAPAPVAATPAPSEQTAASAFGASSPSPAPAAPSPAPSPADDASPPATLFAAAMRKVTAAQTAGHITVAETAAIVQHLGLQAVRDLLARPDLIPTFNESVDLHVARYPAA